MKKKQLLHLHGLFKKLDDYFEEDGLELDEGRYESMEIEPTHLHRSKLEHKAAVLELASTLVAATETANSRFDFPKSEVYGGKLGPRPEAEPHLVKTFSNLVEKRPKRSRPYLPFIVCFIRNGNRETQRVATETILSFLSHSEFESVELSDALLRASEEIEDEELRRRLKRRIGEQPES